MSIWNDKRHNLNVAGGAWRQSGGNWALCYRVECSQKEREREREGESNEVSWLVANHLLSFIHPQTNSSRTNRSFLSFPRSTDLARQYMTTTNISELHWVGVWEPCQQHVHTVIRRYEHRTCEHRANIQKYPKLIKKHIKMCNCNALGTQQSMKLRSQSWAKNNALLG